MSEHDPEPGSEPDSDSGAETPSDTDDVTADRSADSAAPSAPTPARVASWRRHPVRLILASVVFGALLTAAVVAAVGGFRDAGSIDSSGIGASERGPEPNPFNQSAPGDCLTWPRNDSAHPTKIGCGGQHYFEVAGVVDAGALTSQQAAAAVSVGPTSASARATTSSSPSSSVTAYPFGDDAPWPTREQFVALRDETCPVQVNRYLNGRFDPNGRFSVGLLYPSQRQWDAGERAMRCGIQLTNSAGELTPFLGRVADLDQSLHWPVGTCVGIDATSRQPTDAVDCTQRHAFQVTGLIDLGQRFGPVGAGRPWPTIDAQNGELRQRCPALTNAFFGTPAKFAATTLNVQWSTIPQVSWLSGTRTAVCYIGLPSRGGFATLVGDAKGNLLIDGKVPTPPPTEPPGRLNPTPVPLPGGIAPNPIEVPAPAG